MSWSQPGMRVNGNGDERRENQTKSWVIKILSYQEQFRQMPKKFDKESSCPLSPISTGKPNRPRPIHDFQCCPILRESVRPCSPHFQTGPGRSLGMCPHPVQCPLGLGRTTFQILGYSILVSVGIVSRDQVQRVSQQWKRTRTISDPGWRAWFENYHHWPWGLSLLAWLHLFHGNLRSKSS